MTKLKSILLATLVAIVLFGAQLKLEAQPGPFSAQIQRALASFQAGTAPFTNLNVASTSTTTSNLSSSIYTGSTNPSNYYTNTLLSSNITLANAVPFATGLNVYYKYAPTDSDASGSSRIAALAYLETRGSQNLSSFLYSLKARVIHLGTGTVNTISGLESTVFNGHSGEQGTTGGNITTMSALKASLFGQSTNSTIGTEYGVNALVENDNGAGVTTAYGVYSEFAGAVLPTTSYAYYAGTVLGTTKWSFYAADATAPSLFAAPVRHSDGSNTLPSITFSSDPDTGFYSGGSGTAVFAANTTRPVQLSGTGINLGADEFLAWSLANGNSTTTLDTGLSRVSAGLIGVGTGAQGSVAGQIRSSGYHTAGSGMAVANVGANSCGTTTATIAGNNNLWTVTVGATSGTQCRIAFTITAATEWGCAANDDTTTIAVRTTPVDTTHLDILGAFVAGDKVTGVCFPR